MKKNPVGWFEIYVSDMERSRQFYERVFETRLETLPSPGMEMMTFPMGMDEMGAAGALVRMDGYPVGRGNGTIVYFTSEDCAREESRIAEAGGKIQKSKMSIGEYGFISLAFDPDGNIFGIHSKK